MLEDYPILFNNNAIPAPVGWSESYKTVEEVNETEAGTDQVVLIRSDKLSVSCDFNCSSEGVANLASYRDSEPISVRIYDLKTQAYKTRSMRMRNFSVKLVQDSNNTRGTVGLWQVSFDLLEY